MVIKVLSIFIHWSVDFALPLLWAAAFVKSAFVGAPLNSYDVESKTQFPGRPEPDDLLNCR